MTNKSYKTKNCVFHWCVLSGVNRLEVISRASFCNFCKFFFTASNSFLNTQDIYNSMFWAVSRNFILQLFATFSIFACKIGCFKSFTVKCAHKCNLQRINATFAENKCNFLALLLQQKLALVIRWNSKKVWCFSFHIYVYICYTNVQKLREQAEKQLGIIIKFLVSLFTSGFFATKIYLVLKHMFCCKFVIFKVCRASWVQEDVMNRGWVWYGREAEGFSARTRASVN